MKQSVKISLIALAVCSIAACGSSHKSGNHTVNSPSAVTDKQANTQPTNSLPSNKNNAPSNSVGNNTKPSPTQATSRNVETDSNGVKWRNRTLTENSITGSYKTLKVVSNFLDDNTCTGYCVQGGNWIIAPLSAENDHIVIDFKELGNKDGKPYFGVHQGTFSDPTIQGHSDVSGTKVRKKEVDYLFVNQPNTTYGILHDGNTADLFYQGLYAGKPYPQNVIEFVVQNNRNEYLNELKGQATYKGELLAVTRTERALGEPDTIPSKPFVDGTVTLNADFGGSKKFLATDSSVKGEIHSNTLGKISLNETAVHKLANAFEGKAFAGDFTGEYSGLFTGPKLDDAVGRIHLENEDAKVGEMKEYHAVFGGTKQ